MDFLGELNCTARHFASRERMVAPEPLRRLGGRAEFDPKLYYLHRSTLAGAKRPNGNIHVMRPVLRFSIIVSACTMLLPATLRGTPPYGDPNQPYDRIPGTLETAHTKWARPLPTGPIKALFLLPYGDSREVVEIAQRLHLDYTVIMNAGHTAWEKGYGEGENTTPLTGVEAKHVLERIVEWIVE